MEEIKLIPKELLAIIPKFDGDEKLLNIFIRKAEYVLKYFQGSAGQNQYVFQSITSRLVSKAAALISERDDIESWEQLKLVLTQHFGDPRSEECIAIELESMKIKSGESYLDFCNRIQCVRSSLISKVNLSHDANMKVSKKIIYNNMSLNVFLYNLSEDLIRIVRLKNPCDLESALSIVMEEVNFQYQYNARNKMTKTIQQKGNESPQSIPQNPFINKFSMPTNNFKFGIPPQYNQKPNYPQNNQNYFKPKFLQQNPQNPQNFKFGIPPQQNTNNFKFGNQQQQQFKFGIKPPSANIRNTPPQFKFGIKPHPIQDKDVTMRTALPIRNQAQRFSNNELDISHNDTNFNDESENNNEEYQYDEYENYENNETEENSFPENYYEENDEIENFHIKASTRKHRK